MWAARRIANLEIELVPAGSKPDGVAVACDGRRGVASSSPPRRSARTRPACAGSSVCSPTDCPSRYAAGGRRAGAGSAWGGSRLQPAPRELDELKQSFVSMVSHELRTPLTSIVGYLELLREGEAGDLTEDQTRFLEVIDRNTGRLRRLVDDILTISRADSGSPEAHARGRRRRAARASGGRVGRSRHQSEGRRARHGGGRRFDRGRGGPPAVGTAARESRLQRRQVHAGGWLGPHSARPGTEARPSSR